MTEQTKVWRNMENGHHYAIGPDGARLNGFPCDAAPSWVNGEPDQIYGQTVPWGGGECPVPDGVIVRCLFRGRRPYIGPAIWPDLPEKAKQSMWKHAPAPGRHDPANDIVAYQVRLS